MKVAIIYSGEIRTLYKAFPYFKKHCILSEDYHVFGIIQNNGDNNFESFLKNNLGNNLKFLDSFNRNDTTFWCLREKLINNMNLGEGTLRYLRNSGSVIEYYQMFLAYLNIVNYEANNNFKYDYIIRIRCDCVITSPISFDWVNYSKQEVLDKLNEIKNYINAESIIDKNIINIFMNSLLCKERYLIKQDITRNNICITNSYDKFFQINDLETFIDNFYNYFKKGKFLLSFRANIIYALKRKYFTRIFSLGISYGVSGRFLIDEYWWNAETQLQLRCHENNIDIYNSVTISEDKSLYEYNENNYFDSNKNLINTDNVFFFLLRH
jgi:hypothetical protein